MDKLRRIWRLMHLIILGDHSAFLKTNFNLICILIRIVNYYYNRVLEVSV